LRIIAKNNASNALRVKGLQMRILTDKVWQSNFFELLQTLLFLEIYEFKKNYNK